MPSSIDGQTSLPIAVGMPTGAPQKGLITRYFKRTFPGMEPGCGAAGSATLILPAGWYQWQSDRRCPKPLVTDGGAIKITAGACLKVELRNLWACPLANAGEARP